MKNYIVTSVEPGRLIGGNKAKSDVNYFLVNSANFIPMSIIEEKGKFGKLLYSETKLKRQILQSNADNFILQYPVASEFLEDRFIQFIRNKTNAKIFFLIHDISGLQYPDKVDAGFLQRELERFNRTDGLIVHNDQMQKWLQRHHVSVPMVKLKVFDYLSYSPMQKDIPYEGSVCFAGGLGGATFLQKLRISHPVHIMGPNRLKNYPESVIYDGQFLPDELSSHLLQNFGLVWSGNSTDTCTGNLGQYLKYNNPHKVSLYLSNGIPIIIWNQAALANFIRENKLGITVKSLNDLDDTLNKLSVNEYREMKNNAKKVGQQIQTGKFIVDAVNKIIDA